MHCKRVSTILTCCLDTNDSRRMSREGVYCEDVRSHLRIKDLAPSSGRFRYTFSFLFNPRVHEGVEDRQVISHPTSGSQK